MATRFVITFNAHGLKELHRDLDLTFAVHALIAVIRHFDLAIDGSARQHAFGVAFADQLKWRAGEHMEVPWLGVHGRRCPLGQINDFDHELFGNRLVEVSACAASRPDQ